MARRTATAAILIALLLPAVYLGEWPYFLLAAAFLGIAAWEYSEMFGAMAFRPSRPLVVGGVLAILAARTYWPAAAPTVLTACILLAVSAHLLAFERGREPAALDLVITLGGIAYLGWVGAYLADIRNLPDGLWWCALVFPIVWLADSAAYFVGVRFGRHKMAVRLSPGKSWEGYIAGVIVGTASAGVLAYLFAAYGPLDLALWKGILLGFVLSTLTTLGDLGESLFKRFAGWKDSGSVLPGHGGAFDRIDSLIWAGVLGYYGVRLILR
jgi:phosphatidate cytidylyltransferase